MSSAPANVAAPRASEASGYHIPSLGYRIFVAGFRLILWFVAFIALPVAVLAYVHSRGVAIPVSTVAVTTWGLALTVLSTARYVLKPTVAYGPLSIAVAGVLFAYLYYLILLSPYQFVLPGGSASIAAGYSMFLEILLIVPAVDLVAGVLTTIEDATHPGERLPFDYPA